MVPVILYAVFAFGNPDARWGGTYKTCWVVPDLNGCLLNQKEAEK